MEKKTLIEGIAVGAVAGALAGLLLAPKSGQESRDEIKGELMEIKDKIVEQLKTLGDFTQEQYEEVVTAVIAEYSAAKKLTLGQANELEASLWDGYEAIRQTIHERTAPGESPKTA